jgi:hypothetical protein
MKIILFVLSCTLLLTSMHIYTTRAFAQEYIPFVPQWQISGSVFADRDDDRIQDETEAIFPGTPAITIQGRSPTNSTITLSQSNNASGNLILNSDGTFRARRLIPGEYDVTYTPPVGVTIIPTTYRVTVGDGQQPYSTYQCTNAAVTSGVSGVNYCTTIGSVAGNVANLTFAVTTAEPWIRSYGLDVRINSGLENAVSGSACDGAYASLPSATSGTLPGTVSPGIFLVGTNKTLDFAPGAASTNNWRVSDTYTPGRLGSLAVSYASVTSNAKKAGIRPADLLTQSGCTTRTTCSPQNPPSGIYKVDGDLTLTGWNVANDRNYTLLVSGTLTINGNMQVANDNASLLIIAAEDIIVDASVGSEPPYVCPTYNTAHIDGFFSTDQSFIINSSNDCATERILSMRGGIVVNAANTGGRLNNLRNLCGYNAQFPAFSLRARPDMLLAFPDIAKSTNQTFQEVAP